MTEGQRVRVIFANTTTMYHPMHVHGHTFQLGPAGPRKDTVIVPPGPAGRLRLRRGQPRPVDDALPQSLPRPAGRHDGHVQLSDLEDVFSGGACRACAELAGAGGAG